MKLDTLSGPVYRMRLNRDLLLKMVETERIPLIKKIREWTGCCLKEAKGVSDKLMQSAQWEMEDKGYGLPVEPMVDVYVYRGANEGMGAWAFTSLLRGCLALTMECTEDAMGMVEEAEELYGNQVLFCVQTVKCL